MPATAENSVADEIFGLVDDVEVEAAPTPAKEAVEAPTDAPPVETEPEGLAAAEKVVTEEAAPTTAKGVSDNLVHLARQMGMPEHDARSFRSDDSLQDYLNRVGVELARMEPPGAPSSPAVDDTNKLPEFEPFSFDGLNADEFDPNVRKLAEAQDAHYRKQLSRLQQDVKETFEQIAGPLRETIERNKATATREYVRDFDAALAEVGTAYEDRIGKGSTPESLRNGGTPWANRKLLDVHFLQLRRAYDGLPAGMQRPDDKTLMELALRTAFGDRTKEAARAKVEGDVAKHKARVVNRGSSTGSRPPAKTLQERLKRAHEAAAQKMRSFGMDPGIGEEEFGDINPSDEFV